GPRRRGRPSRRSAGPTRRQAAGSCSCPTRQVWGAKTRCASQEIRDFAARTFFVAERVRPDQPSVVLVLVERWLAWRDRGCVDDRGRCLAVGEEAVEQGAELVDRA